MNNPGDPALQELVTRWAALRLGFDPRALRLERLMEAARGELQGLGSLKAMEAALQARDPVAEGPLVAAATVGETYFFRQHEHFDLLAELKLPPSGPVSAWSAGCATGEETYSLAATLRARFHLGPDRLTVWGTDINPKALATAREAHYGRWSWRLDPGPDSDAKQRAALDEQTKACVRFAVHNLLDIPSFDGGQGERFDLVFCRNVLVYFAPLAAVNAVARMREAMKPGAWLVLGNMDLGSAPEGFDRVGTSALCIYAKQAQRSAPAAEPAEAPAPVPAAAAKPKPKPLVQEELDPVDWHSAVQAEFEAGHSGRALQELQLLVEAFPAYLPARFEHALALRRAGQADAACSALRELLLLARGRRMEEIIKGPEPLSLEFYVNSAKSFLESMGERT